MLAKEQDYFTTHKHLSEEVKDVEDYNIKLSMDGLSTQPVPVYDLAQYESIKGFSSLANKRPVLNMNDKDGSSAKETAVYIILNAIFEQIISN